MDVLFHLFGLCVFFVIVVAGIALIVAPSFGRELLKRAAAFTGLFVLAIMLLKWSCASGVRTASVGSLVQLFAGLIGVCLLIASAFGFLAKSAPLKRHLATAALVLGIGIVAPIAVRSLAQSMGSIKLFFAVMAVSVIAYLVREHRKPHHDRSERRRVIERTPVLPNHESECDL